MTNNALGKKPHEEDPLAKMKHGGERGIRTNPHLSQIDHSLPLTSKFI
jgi:hypothetical protein